MTSEIACRSTKSTSDNKLFCQQSYLYIFTWAQRSFSLESVSKLNPWFYVLINLIMYYVFV